MLLVDGLKVNFGSLWGHIVQLLNAPIEVGAKDISSGYRVITRKDSIFVFCHDGNKGPVLSGEICSLLFVVHCTKFSLVH